MPSTPNDADGARPRPAALFERLKDAQRGVSSRGTALLGETVRAAGRGLGLRAPEEVATLRDRLAQTGRDLETTARERVQRMLDGPRHEIERLEVRVLTTIDEVLTRANDNLRDRFALLEEALQRIETRLREAEARGGSATAAAADASPLPDYDQLTVEEIRERIAALSPAELEALRTHEARGKNRKGVLAAIGARLEST